MELMLIAPVWITVLAVIGGLCTLSATILVCGFLVVRARSKNDVPDFTQDALDFIQSERNRQVMVKGFDDMRDDWYKDDQLAIAASCYLYAPKYPYDVAIGRKMPIQWPLLPIMWKPSTPRMRQLQKAGGLLLAEIERQLRKQWYEQNLKANGAAAIKAAQAAERSITGVSTRQTGYRRNP